MQISPLSINNAVINTPVPINEPILSYAPQSPEREKLKATLAKSASEIIEIPLVINGKKIKTGNLKNVVMPHNHQHIIGKYHLAGLKEIKQAVDAAVSAQAMWRSFRFEDRCAIFLKAAQLLADKYRMVINTGSMLAGGKTAFQAEIDAACELIDFLRFNVHFAQKIYEGQPISSAGIWNYSQHRPLEGFVFAITPFNFTAIAGNLPTAPAIMGNTVVWKPASSLVFTPHIIMNVLEEAGLPPGVINFVPSSPRDISEICLNSPELAGIHFTGSTGVFHQIWQKVGGNISKYRSYPRIVGETGGKDFIFAHPSAEVDSLVTAIVRGAFEYQGQKCSAASRAYIPKSLAKAVEKKLGEEIAKIKIGAPTDFRNFMGAVIDEKAFTSISGYIEYSRKHKDGKILIGGKCDKSEGYFIEPTIILANAPDFKTMVEEIFGPVLTMYYYDDKKYLETLTLCNNSSAYALTGAVFAQDRLAISQAMAILENAAGNFYINDKPTGAVVGQQPFGGGRASGTNDKAGSIANLMRWSSTRTIKETFVPPTEFGYPFMLAE